MKFIEKTFKDTGLDKQVHKVTGGKRGVDAVGHAARASAGSAVNVVEHAASATGLDKHVRKVTDGKRGCINVVEHVASTTGVDKYVRKATGGQRFDDAQRKIVDVIEHAASDSGVDMLVHVFTDGKRGFEGLKAIGRKPKVFQDLVASVANRRYLYALRIYAGSRSLTLEVRAYVIVKCARIGTSTVKVFEVPSLHAHADGRSLRKLQELLFDQILPRVSDNGLGFVAPVLERSIAEAIAKDARSFEQAIALQMSQLPETLRRLVCDCRSNVPPLMKVFLRELATMEFASLEASLQSILPQLQIRHCECHRSRQLAGPAILPEALGLCLVALLSCVTTCVVASALVAFCCIALVSETLSTRMWFGLAFTTLTLCVGCFLHLQNLSAHCNDMVLGLSSEVSGMPAAAKSANLFAGAESVLVEFDRPDEDMVGLVSGLKELGFSAVRWRIIVLVAVACLFFFLLLLVCIPFHAAVLLGILFIAGAVVMTRPDSPPCFDVSHMPDRGADLTWACQWFDIILDWLIVSRVGTSAESNRSALLAAFLLFHDSLNSFLRPSQPLCFKAHLKLPSPRLSIDIAPDSPFPFQLPAVDCFVLYECQSMFPTASTVAGGQDAPLLSSQVVSTYASLVIPDTSVSRILTACVETMHSAPTLEWLQCVEDIDADCLSQLDLSILDSNLEWTRADEAKLQLHVRCSIEYKE